MTTSTRGVRVWHEADLHITEGVRWDDEAKVLTALREEAGKWQPDLCVVAGDLTNSQPRRATPLERNAVVRHLLDLAELAPVVIVRGNHDMHGDFFFLNHLRAEHPIHYLESPMLLPIVTEMGAVMVIGIPYPDRAMVASSGGTRDGTSQTVSQALATLLQTMVHRVPDALATVVVAHANVAGSRADNDQPMVGDEVELALPDLEALPADLVALGHIHQPQQWGKVVFAGSPMFHRHGCSGDRGAWRHTIRAGEALQSEFVPMPCMRLVTVDVDLVPNAGSDGEVRFVLHETQQAFDWTVVENTLRGAEVRMRVWYPEADAHQLDRAAVERMLYQAGATRVRIDGKPIVESHVRTPEIMQAKGLGEKVRLYLKERGQDLADEEASKLVDEALAMLEGKSGADVVGGEQDYADQMRKVATWWGTRAPQGGAA